MFVSREEKTRGFYCSRKDAKFSNLEEGCGQSLLGAFLMDIFKNILMSGQKHNCQKRKKRKQKRKQKENNTMYKAFDSVLPHSQIVKILVLCSVNKEHIKHIENLRVNVRRTLASERNVFHLKSSNSLIQHWGLWCFLEQSANKIIAVQMCRSWRLRMCIDEEGD